MPPPSAPSCLCLKPWDKKLRIEFEEVPVNAMDESLWYGPWDTAIHRLFKDGEGFQIALQHLRAGHHGEPKWTVFYFIRAGTIPVCVIEIKPYCDLRRPQAHVSAYRQVEECLKVLVINDPNDVWSVCNWWTIPYYDDENTHQHHHSCPQ
ncbi:hypothetical protein K439DRAFT_1622051 [Ramaria rubella]|nr:hypothetical protein K439DRAFT_1622051 [Ramaria rubella]